MNGYDMLAAAVVERAVLDYKEALENIRAKYNVPFYFGGTSLLIVVGVALDTIAQTEAHLVMRNYEGFYKNSKVKGRWFNVGQ